MWEAGVILPVKWGPAEQRTTAMECKLSAVLPQQFQTWSWSLAGALRLSSLLQQGKIFLIAMSDEAAWPLMASLRDGFQWWQLQQQNTYLNTNDIFQFVIVH